MHIGQHRTGNKCLRMPVIGQHSAVTQTEYVP